MRPVRHSAHHGSPIPLLHCPDFDVCSACVDAAETPGAAFPPRPLAHSASHVLVRLAQPRLAVPGSLLANLTDMAHAGFACAACTSPICAHPFVIRGYCVVLTRVHRRRLAHHM
jgi:hypothetical protein